ncbi:MAG TPA: threonine--tRNA ligase, partial [Candidatus Paceibacterota bacterium]
VAFETKEELDEYLAMMEEAKKRDHRILGEQLKLFTFNDLVGKGLTLWLPNGTIIKNEIEKFAIEMENKYGYQRVSTAHIAKKELFETSGHLPYYADSMYPPMKMDDGIYYLKAMNCPLHHVIYKAEPKSYRDLPVRLAEYGTVYRNELSGTLAGLLRVRSLQMNDAHIYCRKDQIETEIQKVLEMTIEYFQIFGLKDYWFRLSRWSPKNKEKYINEPKNWEYTEEVLRKVLKASGAKFVEVEDEAAFYGPKIDVQFKSVIGREESMSTIQLDFTAKTRFNLTYTDDSGKENNEVFIIHRAPLSTHERFMAFIIEHFAGVFPLWLSPVQVKIIPVSDKFNKYAEEVRGKLSDTDIRVEVDDRNETLGKRIREAETQKTPYIAIVGEKEMSANTLSIRKRGGKDLGAIRIDEFIERLQKEIEKKSI